MARTMVHRCSIRYVESVRVLPGFVRVSADEIGREIDMEVQFWQYICSSSRKVWQGIAGYSKVPRNQGIKVPSNQGIKV